MADVPARGQRWGRLVAEMRDNQARVAAEPAVRVPWWGRVNFVLLALIMVVALGGGPLLFWAWVSIT